jgi:hypothetical protein
MPAWHLATPHYAALSHFFASRQPYDEKPMPLRRRPRRWEMMI